MGHLKLRPNLDLKSIKTLTPQQLLELIRQLDKTLQDNSGNTDRDTEIPEARAKNCR